MNYDNNYPLPDNNYPLPDNDTGFSFSVMFITAIAIVIIILGIWFYFAIQYRYSSERIAEKLRKKYKKEITDLQTLIVGSGYFNNDAKTHVSAPITIQNKDIEGSASTVQIFTLPVKECSPIDYTCVEL